MLKKLTLMTLPALVIFIMVFNTPNVFPSNTEIAGVKFPNEKVIDGKTLKLNGVAILKKFAFLKVYAVGLYLENKSNNSTEIINSEQIKYMFTQYLTDKATSSKIQDGFIKLMNECNTDEMVKNNNDNINKFATWLNKDMKPGLTSETIYIPGEGLTLIYQEEIRGTIPGKSFATMYYNYNIGDKADPSLRKGLLGING